MKIGILGSGFLFVIIHFFYPIPIQLQYAFFFIGIFFLGIPHGAADLLVGMKNADPGSKTFSKFRFLFNYLSLLILFGLFLWMFPFAGILFFLVIASFHFGETDLFDFEINNFAGSLFAFSYGWAILSVLLLTHLPEVKPILVMLDPNHLHKTLFSFIETNHWYILSVSFITFFSFCFYYFISDKEKLNSQDVFLIQFALFVFIIYHLPLILGFSFYFIVWHSGISLRNIIGYLKKDKSLHLNYILKQIILFSIIAFAGLVLLVFLTHQYLNQNSMTLYIFLGLAVLTAPHMEVMHTMFNKIRLSKRKESLS